jgi:predicted O-methyltransferase YrrM
MQGITYDYIIDYINSIQKEWDEPIVELEKFAEENNVPIIQKEVSKFLYVIGSVLKPSKILEVGTAIGYSAIIFSKFLKDNGKIITIEKSEKMWQEAEKNIEKFNLKDTITILKGDALDVLPNINESFDMIFIDASKGHYDEFFKFAKKYIRDGGMIISDNVLYKGMIATEDLVVRRKKTIVNRMRNYLNNLVNDEEFDTSILPIGDGVAISLKR